MSLDLTDLTDLTAVVLAGGLGTRLRAAVPDRPKALAEINGRPFLKFLLDCLGSFGILHTVLCTGYMGDMVRETFGEAYGKMRLSYSPEPSPLGTGGAVRLALSLIDSDPALVMNGDSFFDADLEACYRSHVAAEDVETTMLVCNVSDTARYGRIQMADDRRVLHFDEKGALSGPGWINAGIYFLGRRMVAAIPSSRMISLERDIFPAWIGRGLYACPDEGRFLDIGTPESYREAQSFFDPDTTIHMRKKTRE